MSTNKRAGRKGRGALADARRPVAGQRQQGPAAQDHALLALQRQIGNRAACELLQVGQAKLDVGAADDRYEKEADAVARQVVSSLSGTAGVSGTAGLSGTAGRSAHAAHPGHENCADDLEQGAPTLARQVSGLRRQAEVGAEGGTVGEETEKAISAARGGGAPLPDKARRQMEGAFGADFSSVRVHSGKESEALNDRVQAKAFTIGSDIFFRDKAPDTGTSEGQSLLAHELTHTIQQGGAKAVNRKRP